MASFASLFFVYQYNNYLLVCPTLLLHYIAKTTLFALYKNAVGGILRLTLSWRVDGYKMQAPLAMEQQMTFPSEILGAQK